jgi:hypothetical protein
MVSAAKSRTFHLIRAILVAQLLCLLSSILMTFALKTAQGFFPRGLNARDTNSLAIYAVPLVDDRRPVQ